MCRRSASLVLGFSMIEVACISTNTLPRCSVGVQVGVGTSFFSFKKKQQHFMVNYSTEQQLF